MKTEGFKDLSESKYIGLGETVNLKELCHVQLLESNNLKISESTLF